MDRSQIQYKSYKEKFFELTYNHWVVTNTKQDCDLLLRNQINRWLDLNKDFGVGMQEETLCYIWYTKALEKLSSNTKYNRIYPTIVKTTIK